MSMRQLTVRLLSPTCIALRPTAPGQFTAAPEYLSGTVIRAALASAWLSGRTYEELGKVEQQDFRKLFLHNVVFGNAWPIYVDPAPQTSTIWSVWAVPQTAWTDKRGGGWEGDREQGVKDVLVELLRDEQPPDRYDRVGSTFVATRGGKWCGVAVQRRLMTRTAITRNTAALPISRGVASDGQLYSFEALEAGQRFSAIISCPDDDSIDILERTVQELDDQPASIGQGRSRGMGQVQIRCERINTVDSRTRDRKPSDLVSEVQKFTHRVATSALQNDQVLLPVTLETDVILRDHYLLPCSSGAPEDTLCRYRSTIPSQMKLHYAMQRTRWVGGWDAIRQIPRPPQLAVQQGSVWVYAIPVADLPAAIEWWIDVEAEGIGERRREGFGRVGLLHPLHVQERDIW